MVRILRSFLENTRSIAGLFLLISTMALSFCALPVLFLALFWLR